LDVVHNTPHGADSFYFYTHDKAFLVKTVSGAEMAFLRDLVKPYCLYMANNPQSLLLRLFGLARLTMGNAVRA
jgi:1-phosphatidylinositol-4-phosphate 5-kinase